VTTRFRVLTSGAELPPANPQELTTEFVGDKIPYREQFRPHFGRSLDLSVIDSAIRSANVGLMRQLTDLGRETISLDGHVSSLLQKRLNRVAALDWQLHPAEGNGIDPQKAKDYAEVVRGQLKMIPNFRDRLVDIAWANFDGRSCSEIEWRQRANAFTVQDLHWIHPRRLSFGPSRDLRIIDSSREYGNFADQGFAVEQVPYKFVVFKPRLFGDYQEREGLAVRSVYWSFFMRFGVRERLVLMEIFGKPWRIMMPKNPANGAKGWNETSLQQAYQALNELGYNNTARMPPNVDVLLSQPTQGAGQVHDQVIEHAQKILSKLYLGNTGTTDAVSTGLGSSIGDVHLSEEDLIIAADARRISEVIEDQLTDAIIAVNYGPGEVSHAPKFLLATDAPMDPKTEGETAKLALEVGMRISGDELRERMGYRQIEDDETDVLEGLPAPAGGGFQPGFGGGGQPPGAPPPPVAPPPPDLTDDAEVAAFAERMTEFGIERCQHSNSNRCRVCGIERVRDVTMGEDGQPQFAVKWRPIPKAGAAPVVEPAVVEPPVPVAASSRKLAEGPPSEGGTHYHHRDLESRDHTAVDGAHAHLFRLPDGSIVESELGGDHRHNIDDDSPWIYGGAHVHWLVVDGIRVRTEADGEHDHEMQVTTTTHDGLHRHVLALSDGATIESLMPTEVEDLLGLRGAPGHVCLAAQPQSTFGSPDDLVQRGVKNLAPVTLALGEAIAKAVSGRIRAKTIRKAIKAAAAKFPDEELSTPVDRELMQGLMLGALDAEFEAATNERVAPETFADLHPSTTLVDGEKDPKFTKRIPVDAIKEFESKEVVTRDVFDDMTKAAQRRSFSVAGAAKREVVATVQAELSKQIAKGANLREFASKVVPKLTEAGWTPVNASHVETVFRTNVMGAYNGGRFRQMTQPTVAAVRPFLQIVTVNDGPPLQRKTHQDVHGVIVRSDDPALATAYPPFGYNCRCRVRSVSARAGEGKAVSASILQTAVDPGFSSGLRTLI